MDSLFHRKLRVKLEEAIAQHSEFLGSGGAVDLPHYREVVGHIKAFKEVLEMCREIDKED